MKAEHDVPIQGGGQGVQRRCKTPGVIDFAAAGLGLQYGTVRLVRSDASWPTIARRLAADIAEALGDAAAGIEHIGSSAVPDMLAKPIIDLAVGVRREAAVTDVSRPMSGLGWIYRGDAGEEGGWVFVLEDAPWHRVAHAHGVEFGGSQWVRYLQFLDLLCSDAGARRTYEEAKQRLAQLHPDGRVGYTAGKDPTVQHLLAGGA